MRDIHTCPAQEVAVHINKQVEMEKYVWRKQHCKEQINVQLQVMKQFKVITASESEKLRQLMKESYPQAKKHGGMEWDFQPVCLFFILQSLQFVLTGGSISILI